MTRAQPLGFDATDTLFVGGILTTASSDVIRAELAGTPGVVQVINGYMQPNVGAQAAGTSQSLIRNRGDQEGIQVNSVVSDYGFIDFMRMQVVAGRAYDEARDKPPPMTTPPTSPREEPLVINRSAVRALGFDTPEAAIEQGVFRRVTNNQNGQTFELPLRIIGVVEDNMYYSLRQRPGPQIYQTVQTAAVPPVMLRFEASAASSIQQRVRDTIVSLSGQPPVSVFFLEEQLRAVFVQEQNESRLLLICGGLALLLACIGLYGLAAFSMERKVKEVGVRKALGAASGSIVVLFLVRFAQPVLIANLVAWPVALYFVLQWIERFPYQIERAWLLPLCLGTALAVLLVSMLTVGFITLRAASANPVHSLRYE